MLLFQRAVTEGALSLALQVGKYIDLKNISSEEDAEKYELLLDFLTPIAKTYPSEAGSFQPARDSRCWEVTATARILTWNFFTVTRAYIPYMKAQPEFREWIFSAER